MNVEVMFFSFESIGSCSVAILERTLLFQKVYLLTIYHIKIDQIIYIFSVLWKMVEKLLMSKPGRPSSEESRSSLGGMKWSFASGTNLSSGASIKIERESRQKLNDFAKELRSFRSVDMSGVFSRY